MNFDKETIIEKLTEYFWFAFGIAVMGFLYWFFLWESLYTIWYYNHYVTWIEDWYYGIIPMVIHHGILWYVTEQIIDDWFLSTCVAVGLTILPFAMIGWS